MTIAQQNTRPRLTGVLTQWLEMWNGDLDLITDLVHPEFRIWFGTSPGVGQAIESPASFHEFVTTYRSELPDARFVPGEVTVDETAGRGALVWTVTLTLPNTEHPTELGGVDQLSFVDGRIRRVWSITGSEARPF
jgi:hypothetical protein